VNVNHKLTLKVGVGTEFLCLKCGKNLKLHISMGFWMGPQTIKLKCRNILNWEMLSQDSTVCVLLSHYLSVCIYGIIPYFSELEFPVRSAGQITSVIWMTWVVVVVAAAMMMMTTIIILHMKMTFLLLQPLPPPHVCADGTFSPHPPPHSHACMHTRPSVNKTSHPSW
jgi:hypothetical protein